MTARVVWLSPLGQGNPAKSMGVTVTASIVIVKLEAETLHWLQNL